MSSHMKVCFAHEDEPIIVEFSEPMRQDTAADAYQTQSSSDLVSFEWNEDGTILTIHHPLSPFVVRPRFPTPPTAGVQIELDVTSSELQPSRGALALR